MSRLRNRLIQADDINTNTNNVNNNVNNNENKQDNGNKNEVVALDLLERVENSVADIRDAYYALLDNLNAINESYPNLYNEFKTIVKLPNNNDVKEIVQLDDDVKNAIKYFDDPEYLKGFIGR